MRRFSLMVFLLAVLAAITGTRKETAEPEDSGTPASSDVKGSEPVQSAAASDAAGAGKGATAAHPDGGGNILKTVATIDAPKEALSQPGAISITSAPAALTSTPAPVEVSFKTGRIDPALEDMDLDDLNAAAQTELRRVGCYDAKIDGKWGRKSKAAVEAFGERTGGDWSGKPRAELIVALRGFPAGHCSAAASVAPPETTGQVPPSGQVPSDQSYLPPWMQGEKLSKTETPESAAPGSPKAVPDAGPASSKAKHKNVRRREFARERLAESYERRSGGKSWLPKGWPGSNE